MAREQEQHTLAALETIVEFAWDLLATVMFVCRLKRRTMIAVGECAAIECSVMGRRRESKFASTRTVLWRGCCLKWGVVMEKKIRIAGWGFDYKVSVVE